MHNSLKLIWRSVCIGVVSLCIFASLPLVSFAESASKPLSRMVDYFDPEDIIYYTFDDSTYDGFIIDSTEWIGNLTYSYGNQQYFPTFFTVAMYCPVIRNNNFLFSETGEYICQNIRMPVGDDSSWYYDISILVAKPGDNFRVMFDVHLYNGRGYSYVFQEFLEFSGVSNFDLLGFGVCTSSNHKYPYMNIYYKQNMYTQCRVLNFSSASNIFPSGDYGFGIGSPLAFNGGYILGIISAPIGVPGTNSDQLPNEIFGQMWVNLYNKCYGLSPWLTHRQGLAGFNALQQSINDLNDQFAPSSGTPPDIVPSDDIQSGLDATDPDQIPFDQAEQLDSMAKDQAQAGFDSVSAYVDTAFGSQNTNIWDGVRFAASILTRSWNYLPFLSVILAVVAIFSLVGWVVGVQININHGNFNDMQRRESDARRLRSERDRAVSHAKANRNEARSHPKGGGIYYDD